MRKELRATVNDAVRHYTNLNVFAVVKAVLESGSLYGASEQRVTFQIIKLCDKAMQHQLRLYDECCASMKEEE